MQTKLKYAVPRAEEFLRIIGRSVIDNSRAGNDSILSVQPLLQRAHILVNEIGVLAYKDYTADTEFLGDA